MIPILCALLPMMGLAQKPDLTGAWDGFLVSEGKLAPRGGSWFWKMNLNSDGKFHFHMENHVMMNVVEDADGTYVVSGPKLKLSGKAKSYFDDGYKHSTENRSYSQTLDLRKGLLWGSLAGAEAQAQKMEIVFSRPGQVLSIPQNDIPLQMKPSDSQALNLALKVESKYGTLSAYSDLGTLQTAGADGHVSSKFATMFRRPDQFSFRLLGTGKRPEMEISLKGGQVKLRKGSNSKSEPSITQAFVEVSEEAGEGGFLAASLLMPRLLQSNPISTMRQVLWKGEQTWKGKKYAVIQATNLPGSEIEYWIDPSTFLISRIRHSDDTQRNSLDFAIQANL